MAELTDLRTSDRSARVIAAVRELGLDSRPNLNVPQGLRSLA